VKKPTALILFSCFFLAVFVWVSGCESPRSSSTDPSAGRNAASKSVLKTGLQEEDKGIGPIKSLKLGPVDKNLAAKGQQIFEEKCTACHSLDTRKTGPALGKVLESNPPEFVMNFLLNTTEMEEKDPKIKELIQEYGIPMPDLGLSQDQARAILEYFRSVK
jgi:cytochrome c